MFSRSSIKNKLLFFSLLATLVPSLGLGLLLFWQYKVIIDDNVTHQLRTLTDDAGRELEYWVKKQTDNLRVLATSQAVVEGLARHADQPQDRTSQALPHYLRLVQEKLDPLLELTVLDASGQRVASSALAPTRYRLSDPGPPTAGDDSTVLAPPHWDAAYQQVVFSLAVPVLSLDDKVIGQLVAVIKLDALQSRLDYVVGNSPGDLVLVDLAGRPLLDTQRRVGQFPVLAAPVLRRLRQHPGVPSAFDGHFGVKVLGMAQRSAVLPILIVAERERSEIYSDWREVRNLFLGLLAGLTLLVGFAGWRIGRSIVMPLNDLAGAADRVAQGNLSVCLPIASKDEIGHLTRVFNQMTGNLRQSQSEVEAANLALQQKNELLQTLSVTDGLTGLYNRNKLDEILGHQFAGYRRHRRPFAVLMLDIDHFKRLNDSFGHQAGDQVLKQVAALLSASVRSVDFAARYGGEEFVLVLPETTLATARQLAERICHQVEAASVSFDGHTLRVTLSIGVAGVRDDDGAADAVVARADQLLYAAKHAGRNRVHCSG